MTLLSPQNAYVDDRRPTGACACCARLQARGSSRAPFAQTRLNWRFALYGHSCYTESTYAQVAAAVTAVLAVPRSTNRKPRSHAQRRESATTCCAELHRSVIGTVPTYFAPSLCGSGPGKPGAHMHAGKPRPVKSRARWSSFRARTSERAAVTWFDAVPLIMPRGVLVDSLTCSGSRWVRQVLVH